MRGGAPSTGLILLDADFGPRPECHGADCPLGVADDPENAHDRDPRARVHLGEPVALQNHRAIVTALGFGPR